MVAIDGEPWFIVKDVMIVLGMDTNQSTNYTRNLSNNEKRTALRSSITQGKVGRGAAYISIVSESGLYKLVMRSDKPDAKAFQDWVTRVVLPAIRKDGGYILGQEKAFSGEMPEDELMARVDAKSHPTV